MQLKNVYWRDTGKVDPETGKKVYLAETDKPSVEELLDGRVVRTVDQETSVTQWAEQDNPFTKGARTMRFMRRGKPMVVEFGSPHVKEWLASNDVDQIPGYLKGLATYMGYLRNAYITYSPEFPLRNAIRDGTTGLLHLGADFDAATATAIGNPKRLAQLYRGLWKAFRHNKFEGPFGKSIKSFLYHGGKSGYYQLNQMKKLTKDLKEAIEDHGSNWYKTKSAAQNFHNFMQSYTSSIENLIRLSGYDYFINNDVINPKTGKPFTQKQAASYFKDLTVNFDRKGSWGGGIGTLWIFYNATLQNIARLAEPFFEGDARRKRRAAAVPLIMASTAYLWADMLRIGLGVDEDDEYRFDKLNDFTITHRIMLPNFFSDDPGDVLSVPLPYGQNAYWAAGVFANKIARGSMTADEAALNMASTAWQSYNPIGGEAIGSGIVPSGLKTMLPTVTIPPYELAINTDFRGLPIVPQRRGRDVFAPEHQNYRHYTSGWAKETAKALNKYSGGDEYTSGLIDVSPNQLEFLINSYLGGAGNFAFSAIDAAGKIANHMTGEEELTGEDLRRFPVARVYFSAVPKSANRERFYDNMRELERIEWRFEQIAENQGYEAAHEYMKQNRDMFNLIGLKNNTRNAVSQHFRYLRQMPGEDREAAEKLLERINQFYTEFNREYNRVTGRAASQNPVPQALNQLLQPISQEP